MVGHHSRTAECWAHTSARKEILHTTFALCETCAELGTSLAAEPSAPSASATLEHHSRTAECYYEPRHSWPAPSASATLEPNRPYQKNNVESS